MDMPSAAVVFVSDDGRVGLGLRSQRVRQPLTWAAIGGFRDLGETGYQTVYREVWEELGMRLPNRVEYLGSTGPHELYLCRVAEPFQPRRLNWENADFQWRTLLEWNNYDLHPELRRVLRGRKYLAEDDEFAGTREWIEKNYGKHWDPPKDPQPHYPITSGAFHDPQNYPKGSATVGGRKYTFDDDRWATLSQKQELLKRRAEAGGVPLNWLNLFGNNWGGLVRMMQALGLKEPVLKRNRTKKDYYPPYQTPDRPPYQWPQENPWQDPRTQARINPYEWWTRKKYPEAEE
tara:strand:- start:4678 stop:5547 length:870 start_codon:yes stop_codon:yes gene_type:complete